MPRIPLPLGLLVAALLLVTGCDSVQDEAGLPEAIEQDASSVEAQVDYSLISEEAETMLLNTIPLQESLLSNVGFLLNGAVFTMSDDAGANAVLAFSRDPDGRLTPAGSYPTLGAGSGDGLNGTSNPMALASGNRFLYVVNGGSDEITAFRVQGTELTVIHTIASGGPRPISITTRRNFVYVLNAGREGEPGNITGFRSHNGRLFPLSDATQPLNEGAGSPSQIAFNPTATLLVITDKATNTITTYPVDQGRADAPQTYPSNGETAFGFDFDRNGRLYVSEAFGGAEDASAVSSYHLDREGTLTTINATVPTTETAACWVETYGRYAYATNTASSSVTGYRITGGMLTLLDEDGVTVSTGEGSQPLDMDIALRYLYVHSAGTNEIGAYRIHPDGSLTAVSGGAATGLPETTVGVAAY